MILYIIAFISTLFFTAICLYVSIVEQPARMLCSTATALEQWRPGYRRAAALQIVLAITSIAGSIMVYTSTNNLLILFAALSIMLVIPFTLIVIMPVNKSLLQPGRQADNDTRELLAKWGRLHHIRTLLSLTATLLQVAYFVNFLNF